MASRFELNEGTGNTGRLARQQARRRRRERAAGFVVVGIGVAVLIVALAALREPKGHVAAVRSQHGSASSVAKQSPTRQTSSPSSPVHRTSSSATTTQSGPKRVPLIVLNNTTTQGLAAQAARRFEAGGWTVTASGNLKNDIASTCAYYDPANPQAKAAAEALQAQYPTIKRVKPRFAELPNGPVVVVLTPDYSSG